MADKELKVKLTADIADLETKMKQASKAAQNFENDFNALGATSKKSAADSKAAIAAWTASFAPLQSAFTSSITGMIRGTTTWRQAVQNVTKSLLTEETNFAVKRLSIWAAQETGITKILGEEIAKRGAAEAASQNSVLELLGKTLARWLGFETAKTAATETGAATRTAAEQSASAVSMASAALKAIKSIINDAAQTFAGVFAFLAPEMGPAAAGPAAASSAVVMGATANILSAAGGLWSVPADMLALVHKQETIVPASVAAPMRDFFTSGGAAARGGSYAITIQAIDTQSGAQFLMNNAGAIVKSLAREMRNGNALFRAGS